MTGILFALVAAADRVSLTAIAEPAPRVIERIATLAGRKLDVAPALADEILIVSAESVSTDDLLDRIAFATVGVWKEVDGVLRLVPDEERRREQERKAMERRIAPIQKELDRLAREVTIPYDAALVRSSVRRLQADPENPRPLDKRFLDFQARLPAARLAYRTLIALGAERLASIRPGERLVIAPQPTSLQSKWPNGGDLYRLFEKEQSIFDAEAPVAAKDKKIPESLRQSLGSGKKEPPTWMSISPVDLGVSPAGVLLGFGPHMVQQIAVSFPGMAPVESGPVLQTADTTSLPLDAESELLRRRFESPSTSRYDPLPPALSRALADPDQDLLRFGVSVTFGYARALGRNLVALVPDSWFARYVRGRGAMTPQLVGLSLGRDTVVTAPPGWLVLTPKEPVAERDSRDRRAATKRLVEATMRNGYVGVLDLGNYLIERPVGIPFGLGVEVLAQLGAYEIRTAAESEDALRLLASLTPEQTRLMNANDGRLAFTALDARQRACVHRMVYGKTGQFARKDIENVLGSHGAAYGGYLDEPTMTFPGGIPPSGFVRVLVRDVLQVGVVNEEGRGSPDSPEWVGSEEFYRRHPELVDAGTTIPTPLGYRPFEQRRYAVGLYLSDKLRILYGFLESKPGKLVSAVSDLPAPLRDAINTEIERLERLRADGRAPKHKPRFLRDDPPR